MRRPIGAYSAIGMGEGEGVSIQKAENGYMITLVPPGNSDLEFGPFSTLGGDKPEPHQLQAMREAMEKSRPRVFVFSDIEVALEAIKEFLLDGKLPPGR